MALPWRVSVLWLVAACIGAHGLLHPDSSKVRKIPVREPEQRFVSSADTNTLQLRSHSLAVVSHPPLSGRNGKLHDFRRTSSTEIEVDKKLIGHSHICIQICKIDILILDKIQ